MFILTSFSSFYVLDILFYSDFNMPKRNRKQVLIARSLKVGKYLAM